MDALYLTIVVLLLCLVLMFVKSRYTTPPIEINKLNKKFYKVREVSPHLDNIYDELSKIKNEVNEVVKNKWISWPEKYLYARDGDWNIFPFYAFGIWIQDNCEKCPKINSFLKSIPGLKLATLSRMTPGMKLTPHEGWASHSNYVIRCHFGITVPNGCYISVKEIDIYDPNDTEKIKYHKENEWLIFDDSKTHYAHNTSNYDRVVLIIDVEMPKNIKIGKSKVGDSKELINIVNYFKEKNISTEELSRLPSLD